ASPWVSFSVVAPPAVVESAQAVPAVSQSPAVAHATATMACIRRRWRTFASLKGIRVGGDVRHLLFRGRQLFVSKSLRNVTVVFREFGRRYAGRRVPHPKRRRGDAPCSSVRVIICCTASSSLRPSASVSSNRS